MARFDFVAQDKYKGLTKGDIEAGSREEALEILAKRGLSPIKLDLQQGSGTPGKGAFQKLAHAQVGFGGGHLTMFDQITIIRHLGTILNTGSDISGGLQTISEDAAKPIVRKILLDVRERIFRGESFSDALKHWEDQFNPIFISLVKAGEASGNLPNILLSYAQELRKEYSFSRKLKSALVYPAILFLALFGMVILMLTFVIPKLQELFRSTKAEPPIYTKILFSAADLWSAYMFPILGGLAVLILLLGIAFKNKRLRRKITSLLWYFPLLNRIQKNLMLARFTKTVATLVNAGFSLKASLMISGEILNEHYQKVLTVVAEEKLDRGISFSQALGQYPKHFPKILVSVIGTGERSGQLSSVLMQMSEFYEEEVIYELELFLTLIEPIMLFIVGIVVLLMAFSLISPVYSLIGRFR